MGVRRMVMCGVQGWWEWGGGGGDSKGGGV